MSQTGSSAFKYDAFICHSHQNSLAAKRLHRRIIRYRPPAGVKVSRRRLSAFLDRRNLLAHSSLRGVLAEKIRESRYLIYLGSHHAARSDVVNYEIKTFLAKRGANAIRIGLIDGQLPDVLPPAARGRVREPLYADLSSGESRLWSWWLRDRWRFRGESLRLLGALLGVKDYEDLTQRERRRARTKAVAWVAAAVAPVVALSIVVSLAPGAAWTGWERSQLEVTRAVVVADEGGQERIRALSEDYIPHPGDGAGRYVRTIYEVDLRGRITGRLSYYFDDAGTYLDSDDRDRGTLADEARELDGVGENADEPALESREPPGRGYLLVQEAWPILFAASSKPLIHDGYMVFELDEPGGSEHIKPREMDRTELSRAATASLAEAGREARAEGVIIYRMRKGHYLAFVGVRDPISGFELGTVPLRSDDEGGNWHLGSLAPFDVSGIGGLADDGEQLWLAAENTQANESGRVGGLYVSIDRGLSWERVPLPEIWRDWPSLADVAAHSGKPGVVAIASSPRGSGYRPKPANVPGIMITTDGSAHWKLLATGFDASQDAALSLVGLSSSGDVVALLDRSLIIWRRLSYLERLLRRY